MDEAVFQETFDVKVSVAYVGTGANSPSRQYRYKLHPGFGACRPADTQIRDTLDQASCEAGSRFEGCYCSDSHKQLRPVPDPHNIVPSGKSTCVDHVNDSKKLLLNILLMVVHMEDAGKRVGVDPHITKVPAARQAASPGKPRTCPARALRDRPLFRQ